MKKYPDMTELFERKEARRRKLASLPIEDKMEIAERLREIGQQAPGRRTSAGKTKWSVVELRPKKKRCA